MTNPTLRGLTEIEISSVAGGDNLVGAVGAIALAYNEETPRCGNEIIRLKIPIPPVPGPVLGGLRILA